MAAPWLVVGLGAVAAGCASSAGGSKSPGAAPDAPPPPQLQPHDEVPSPGKKALESTTPAVQCEALAKEKCEAPCSWDKLAEKCTQSLSIVVHE